MRTHPLARCASLLCSVLVLVAPRAASAQKERKGSVPVPACQFDTAAHTTLMTRQLGIVVSRASDTISDPSLTKAFGAVIRAGFVAPASVQQLFFPAMVVPWDAPVGMKRSRLSNGALSLRVSRDGVVRNLAWDVPSYDPATEDSITRPLIRASGTPEMLSLGAILDSGLVRIFLNVSDSGSTQSAPLLLAHLRATRIDKPVEYLSGPIPQYPMGELSRGIEGRVSLHFIVGDDGKVVENSVRVDQVSSPAFARPAAAAIAAARFTPARVAGCPTPMLVEQVVRFTIGRR